MNWLVLQSRPAARLHREREQKPELCRFGDKKNRNNGSSFTVTLTSQLQPVVLFEEDSI